MSPYVCLLITILYQGMSLMRVALKCSNIDLAPEPLDCETQEQWERENDARMQSVLRLLPPHVRSAGSIVQVETIYEVEAIL